MKLKFTCPKCGKHQLGSVEQVLMTYPVIDIDLGGKCLDYDSDNPTAGESSEVMAYQCMNCGWEIENERGNSLIEQEDVVKWIAENCPQNGSMTHLAEGEKDEQS